MNFWKLDHLELNDRLIREIWDQSPVEQDSIQPYQESWEPGEIGAQQAMRLQNNHRIQVAALFISC